MLNYKDDQVLKFGMSASSSVLSSLLYNILSSDFDQKPWDKMSIKDLQGYHLEPGENAADRPSVNSGWVNGGLHPNLGVWCSLYADDLGIHGPRDKVIDAFCFIKRKLAYHGLQLSEQNTWAITRNVECILKFITIWTEAYLIR